MTYSGYEMQLAEKDARIEALRQQLDWVRNVVSMHGYDGPFGDGCCPLADWLNERESLRQQLAAALAAIKVKDGALQLLHDEKCDYMRRNKLGNPYLETATKLAVKALAIQPDDSALKAWLGEPVAWKHDDPKRHDAITDSVKELLQRANSEYMHRPIDKTEHYTIPLYSPKGI